MRLLIVVVVHDPHGYRTVYCHLATIAVKVGESVTRGQRAVPGGPSGAHLSRALLIRI